MFKTRMRYGLLGLVVATIVASSLPGSVYAQSQAAIPQNASPTIGGGWICNDGYVKSKDSCVTVADATDSEIREQMIQRSIMSYSGNCPCPYFTDRAGRSCGRRSAYSRPGGASPLCYERDISDKTVATYRMRYGG